MGIQSQVLGFMEIQSKVLGALGCIIEESNAFEATDQGAKYMNLVLSMGEHAMDTIDEKVEKIKSFTEDKCDLGECENCNAIKEFGIPDHFDEKCPIRAFTKSLKDVPDDELRDTIAEEFKRITHKNINEYLVTLLCMKKSLTSLMGYVDTVLKDSRLPEEILEEAKKDCKVIFPRFQNSVDCDMKASREFPVDSKVIVKGVGIGFVPDENRLPDKIVSDKTNLSIDLEEPFIIVAMQEVFDENDPRYLQPDVADRDDENPGAVLNGVPMSEVHRNEIREALKSENKKLVLCTVPVQLLERTEE